MRKRIRILAAIIVILSFVMLGRNEAAWAANSGSKSSASQSSEQSVAKRCDNDKRHGRSSCDDDDDDDHGTVKPPRRRTRICKLGSASVGGQAIIEVKRLGRGDCVVAFIEPYNSRSYPPLPRGARVLSDVLSVKLPKTNALVKICFAVPPGKNASIYVISRGAWTAVGSGKKGTVCTETSRSGTYILLGK